VKILRDIRQNRVWYFFIAPDMVLFTVFIIYPLLRTLYGSFFKWGLQSGSEFVGLVNYINLLQDRFFIRSFSNTLLFAVTITPLAMILGLIAALLVDSLSGWFKYFARIAIFTPYICSLIVASVIWKSLLEPNGVIQSSLAILGIITPAWLSDPDLSIMAVILMTVWQTWGFSMIFYLAGLQGIPKLYYEAAMVDGASDWHTFWRITLPLLKPTTLFLLVVNTIFNLKMFDQVMGLTRGGPMNATLTTMVYIYQKAFSQQHFGPASASAVLFSISIFAIALIQMYILKGQVEY